MKKKEYLIAADLEYVVGHLRCGHVEAVLTEEEYEEYKALSDDEKADYLNELGDLIIDDVSIEDRGPLQNIEVIELIDD